MLLLLFAACGVADPAPDPTAPEPMTQAAAPSEPEAGQPERIEEAFPLPTGAERVATDAYGSWLRTWQVATEDEPVRTFDGHLVNHHARVIEMDLVDGDLQQCADSAMRLRAEWLRQQSAPISFHATSGDPIDWDRYRGGERPYESGGRLAWKAGGAGDWDGYLTQVFMWAGTRSLAAYDTVRVTTPRAGDMLVEAGSPGHAVVLLDVATRGGQTLFLIGEGFMPAQSFHVEIGPEQGWWLWDEGLSLPAWSFAGDALRRWNDAK